MNPRLILYGALFLAGAGAVAGIWWHGNSHGKRSCQQSYEEALHDARNESRQLADALEQATQESRKATQAKTRIIYREADPTGCADVPAIGSVLDALRGPAD